MTNASARSNPFWTGTKIPVNKSYAYIVREVEKQVLNMLQQGKLCYVLGPRKVGKSSMFAKLQHEFDILPEYLCAYVNIQNRGKSKSNSDEGEFANEFYKDLIKKIISGLMIESDLLKRWDEDNLSALARWTEFCLEEIPAHSQGQKVIIFLDEIDDLANKPISAADFLLSIRAIFDEAAVLAGTKQITFCLTGGYPVKNMIPEAHRSPFNIGEMVWLPDFSHQEVEQ